MNLDTMIAIVEDDEAVLRAVSFALTTEGYEVLGFCGPRPLLLSPALMRFSCLVIDYRLSDMDGLTLAQRLRVGGIDAPIILVTTQPSVQCRRRAAQLSCPIVEKPLMGDALSNRIRNCLSGETAG